MIPYERSIGSIFDDRYRIDKLIGVGGMAVVFEAFDLRENRVVAVKLLREEISRDVVSVRRFLNESIAVSYLNHPNIVRIFDVKVSDARKYIVMERVLGVTLKKFIETKKRLSHDLTASISAQVLEALVHAHERGIIHRDIKPQNILVQRDGTVKVTDFGIALLPDPDAEGAAPSDRAIGTVNYISPEQASAREVDARTDLYSLGVAMYEMITGVLPFEGKTPLEIAQKQVSEPPPPPSQLVPGMSPGLEEIILTAMQKNPDDRFSSAEEMLSYVRKVERNPRANLHIRTGRLEVTEGGKTKKRRHASFLKPSRYHEEKRSNLPIILGVSLAFLLVGLVTGYYVASDLFSKSALNFFKSDKTEEVTVGSYAGSPYDDLMQADLTMDGVSFDVTYEFSEETPAGTVMAQDPLPGAVRKEGNFTLHLTVSKGPEVTAMDNVTMKEYRAVKIDLLKRGYVVNVEKVESDVFDAGVILYSDPAAGEPLSPGQIVTLTVSRGVDITYVTVPDVRGMTSAEASAKIVEAGLRVGEISPGEPGETPDIVLSQSRTPGQVVPAGSYVGLTVTSSAAPAPEPAPDTPPADPAASG